MFDCIIIGAGPAGISASLYLARASYKVLVIYKDLGALEKAEKIENYYGLPTPISGTTLANHGIMQAKNLGVSFAKEEVFSLGFNGNFLVSTNKDEYSSKTLLIAIGSSRKTLDIKGIEDFTSKGVSYCAVCDGFFYKGKDIAVVGNSEYTLHELEYLKNLAKNVYLLTNGEKLKQEVNYPNVTVIEDKIIEISGDTRVNSVVLQDSTISVSGVFIANDTLDANGLAKKIGIVAEDKNISVNDKMETNIPGIYAAGDCVKGIKQIYKAVADGANAAFSIINYLKQN